MDSLEDRIKADARGLGFDPVGIARATEADGFARLKDWLARGYAGEMDYMRRHAEARRHPAAVLPDVKSVVMVGMGYGPLSPESSVLSPEQNPRRAPASGLRTQDSGLRS